MFSRFLSSKSPESTPEWPAIQAALRERAHMAPSQEYFDGLLSEFHYRQRIALLQPASVRRTLGERIGAWLESWKQEGAGAFRPAYAALAACVVVALMSVAAWNGSEPASANLAMTEAPASSYAFKQALQINDQADALDVFTAGQITQVDAPANYLLVSSSAGYDNTLAF